MAPSPELKDTWIADNPTAEKGQYLTLRFDFPAEALLRQDHFVSLLYYLGLLSFAGEGEGTPLLKIPNRTVRQLMYGYLRAAYDEVGVFHPSAYDVAEKLRFMAYRGEWEGFFDYLAEQVAQQASVRDFLQGEKMTDQSLHLRTPDSIRPFIVSSCAGRCGVMPPWIRQRMG